MFDELKLLLLSPPRFSLAVAESLTCGQVQARIGEITGASQFFLGGVTAYNLEQKVRHLGIDRALAEPVNCVSREVAEQMARGACYLFGSDLALATTGYAEATPEWNIAEPFAWWALVHRRPDQSFTQRSGRIDGAGTKRGEMQARVTVTVIDELVNYLRELRG